MDIEKKYRRKFQKKGILFFITLIVVMSIILLYFLEWNTPTSTSILKKSQSFVVELKSQTNDEYLVYGSAVIIDSNGTLISNAHMVTYKESGIFKTYDNFEVRFAFEDSFHQVTLIKYDLDQDIAVLKIDKNININYKPAKIADNAKIKAGDKVYAIGNGMNHGISISQGIISLAQVNINYGGITRSVIQCDLTINEGNSGGALLDEQGRLIGIISFRIKDNQGNPVYGIAFSIPINLILTYLNLE